MYMGLNIANKGIKSWQYGNDLNYVRSTEKQVRIMSQEEVEPATVVTANLQNKFFQPDGESQSISYLLEQGTDVISTQETTKSVVNSLDSVLKQGEYNITGDYRWGNGIIGLLFSIGNEGNQIISKNEIFMSRTDQLPWIPESTIEWGESIKAGSIMPRIVTSCVTEIDGIGYCRIYNTHLDYGSCSIQKKQMDKILDIIDKDKETLPLPIIITGDWNAIFESENMQYFTGQLQNRNIILSVVDQPTYKGKIENGQLLEKPEIIDYIAIDGCIEPIGVTIKENTQSDHDMVLVKIRDN